MKRDESGFALLMAIFMIAIATIIVFDFMTSTNIYQRRMRAFVEDVQGVNSIRSAANVAVLLLTMPKGAEDTLNDDWAKVASYQSIPLEGFSGTLRMEIVDEDGKINIGNIVSSGPPSPTAPAIFWRNALIKLFEIMQLGPRSFEKDSSITVGDTAFESKAEVAAIIDWNDTDREPFEDPSLGAQGIESTGNAKWFFNRPLKNLWELTYIPGMTYERVRALSPFVRVSSNTSREIKINYNTADEEVLLALGLPPSDVAKIMEDRIKLPGGLNQQILNGLLNGYPDLIKNSKTNSSEFSALIRLKLPVRTIWGRALIKADPVPANTPRKPKITSLEIF